MKKKSLYIFCTILSFCLLATIVSGQGIYSKAYGDKNNPAIIFIHGGPSGNSTLFEYTTAQILADRGFYVIVYDRRGEGRSVDSIATFTFQEAFYDLNDIYKEYNIKQAGIIAHSFGGLVATLYAEKYPQNVESLVLVAALFSQQETYDHILKTLRELDLTKKDSLLLNKIAKVERLPKNSAEYRQRCYALADQHNFFSMPNSTKEAIRLREEYEKSDLYKCNIRNPNASVVFYKNEPLNNIDTKSILKKIVSGNMKVYAIYGKQDGIFSTKQMSDMKQIVGKQKFRLIDNCSHYLFVDQQRIFVDNIEKWLKK